jgi:hypothetical protein
VSQTGGTWSQTSGGISAAYKNVAAHKQAKDQNLKLLCAEFPRLIAAGKKNPKSPLDWHFLKKFTKHQCN